MISITVVRVELQLHKFIRFNEIFDTLVSALSDTFICSFDMNILWINQSQLYVRVSRCICFIASRRQKFRNPVHHFQTMHHRYRQRFCCVTHRGRWIAHAFIDNYTRHRCPAVVHLVLCTGVSMIHWISDNRVHVRPGDESVACTRMFKIRALWLTGLWRNH